MRQRDFLRVAQSLNMGVNAGTSTKRWDRHLIGQAGWRCEFLTCLVLQGKGQPGVTMGDWLVEQGVDQPKAERPKAPSLDAVRRQQSVLQRAAAAAAAPTPGAPGRQVGPITAC